VTGRQWFKKDGDEQFRMDEVLCEAKSQTRPAFELPAEAAGVFEKS